MIIGVDAPPCTEDKGLPEPEAKPCAITPWCSRAVRHDGACTPDPRTPRPAPDFGPRSKR